MMPSNTRQMAAILSNGTNGTPAQMSAEDMKRHMVAQYAYQQQLLQAQQAQQLAQANAQFRSEGINGSMRQFHAIPPQYMQPGPDSGNSPSTDSGRSYKRQADTSPIEGSSKKPRLVGKRPSTYLASSQAEIDIP